MKLELKTMYFSTFINIVISILKISGGIMLHTFTLTIDGIYTVSDLVTDVIAVLVFELGGDALIRITLWDMAESFIL